MKVELGAVDWSSGEGRFIHEATLAECGGLVKESWTIEGAVRSVGDDGGRLEICERRGLRSLT